MNSGALFDVVGTISLQMLAITGLFAIRRLTAAFGTLKGSRVLVAILAVSLATSIVLPIAVLLASVGPSVWIVILDPFSELPARLLRFAPLAAAPFVWVYAADLARTCVRRTALA